jgi:16S rRNA (cytidine1402-2'-O)-methyltransferase
MQLKNEFQQQDFQDNSKNSQLKNTIQNNSSNHTQGLLQNDSEYNLSDNFQVKKLADEMENELGNEPENDANDDSTNNLNHAFFLPPALYVVATPIGNAEDITLRAIRILKDADYVICEDSRVTAKLLAKLGIKKSLIIYNDHSDEQIRERILKLILEKKSLALISDAGTPLISDPGYKLTSFLLANNIKVIPIPGACSVIAALSVAGIESNRFLFTGFIPNSAIQRDKFFKEFATINSTLIFFESALRISTSLKAMLKILGNRTGCVARELTKIYEETKKDYLEKLVEYYENNKIKGEVVILISPPESENKAADLDLIDQELKSGIGKMKPKELVALVAENHKINKKIVYNRMMEIIKG